MANFNSIKFRVMAFGVVLVAASLASHIFVGIPFVREKIAELVSAQELTIATYVAENIDYSIRSRLDLVGALAADLPPAAIAQPDKLRAWLQERHRANPMFNGLLVVRPDGHGLLGEYPEMPGRERLDYTDSDWFRGARQSSRPVLGKPTRGRVSGAPLIVMAAPVRDAAGHVVAVLSGISLLNTPGFLDSLQKTRLGTGGGFLLVSPADRLFIASSDPSLVLTATPPAGVNLLHDRAMLGFRGTGITVNAKGVEEMSAMVTVATTGWFVVARMPAEEAFRAVTAFRAFTLRSTLFVLVAMIGAVLVFLSAMLKPLVEAARAMRDMADGKRELAQLPVQRNDEVGNLVLGFNHLVAKLNEKEAALHNAVKRLDQLASTDALTGAWNRRQFDEVVDTELDRSMRYRHPISLMLLDLDLFKTINDNHGHAEGDRVLQQVADCIRGALRKSDSLFRWGGEEFMILMPDTGLSNAAVLAERVRESIASHSIEGLGSVTASIGVAEFVASESRDQWVTRADAAMYRAKHGGRNRVEVDTAPSGATSLAESKEAGFAQLIWSDRFRSGNQTLDSQHQGLFDDSNKLLAAILSGRCDGEVDAALDTLMRDMVCHFQDEDKLLLAVGYPHTAAHTALHGKLVDSAVERVERFRAGRLDIGALFQFLARDVVAKHMLSEDREFFPYVNLPSG